MVHRRASLSDVAALAGVSGQTVSRVVNGSQHVGAETRRRVELAMAELGYQPHRAARALRTGRSHTIGVVVATLATVGNSRMLEAVASAAAHRDLGVALAVLRDRSGLDTAFAHLRQQGVDGAIVLNEATMIAREAEAPDDIRIVAVDSPSPAPFATVRSDHAGGAAAAVARLLERGHATVWHLAGPAGSFAADERLRGWREALLGAGVEPPAPLRGDWTAGSGYNAGSELARRKALTAVFAGNDQMALGLLRAFADAGRPVPDQVAVIGFDDVADAADYRPPLTTLRQDFTTLGETAVEALVAAVAGTAPTDTVIPVRLIARASG